MMDIRQIVKDILNNPNVLLTSDSCSGFPYLQLTSADYSLLAAKDTYEDLANLIKAYSQDNKWESAKTCFFDVHPVFADGRAVPGLMGLHLALMLYDQGIAGSAQTLYFDIASKWAKAALITEPKVYCTASWINFNRQDIQEYEAQIEGDDGAGDEDQELFIKSSINLIKGGELLSAHSRPQADFNSRLFEYHKTQNERKVLINELQKYRDFITYDIQKTPSLERSALYLFGVIFCREFGFSYSIFISVINELNLKFDFGLSQDIITYCLRALHYIQELRVDVGDYSQHLLDYKQTDISLQAENQSEDGESTDLYSAEDGPLVLASFSEEPNNYSLVGVTRFYEMLPAIKDELECRKLIYKLWRNLVLCFYGQKLDQDLYDKLRSLTDTHVTKAVVGKKLLEFSNYDTQYSAIKMAAYDVYVQTMFDFSILNKQGSAVAEQLFEQLNDPKLTDNQAASINLLNEKAQRSMIKSIMDDHFKNLNTLLIQSIGQIAHHDLHKGYDDERLSVIDNETFRQMVVQWYRDNYIKAYLELTNDYEEIYALIKRDADLFASDPLVEKSMVTEVRCFVSVIYNPYLILDFATNY